MNQFLSSSSSSSPGSALFTLFFFSLLVSPPTATWAALPFGLFESQEDGKCKLAEHLKSNYVTAIQDQTSNVTACVNGRNQTKFQEVYVISLISSGFNDTSLDGYLPTVSFTMRAADPDEDYKGNVAILLHSKSPVIWHIYAENIDNSSNITLVTTHSSEVVQNIPFPVKERKKKGKPTLKKLIAWASRELEPASGVFKIDMANQITVTLGSSARDSKQIEDCAERLKPLEHEPRVLEAIYSRPQTAGGCETREEEEESGTVFVIELEPSGSNAVVCIAPHGSVVKSRKAVLKKKLIFVLHSARKITWSIESWGVEGPILAYSQYPVLREKLPKFNKLTVRNVDIPAESEQIVRFVEESVGSIHTYIKAKKANKILILLENREDQLDDRGRSINGSSDNAPRDQTGLSTLFTLPNSRGSSEFSRNLIGYFHSRRNSHLIQSPTKHIINHTTLTCSEGGGLQINISLSAARAVVRQLLGLASIQEDAISVSLQHCDSNKSLNRIWFEERDPTTCGTAVYQEENQKIYENQLMFWYKLSTRSSFAAKRALSHSRSRPYFPGETIRQNLQETTPTNSGLLFPIAFRCTKESSVQFLTHQLEIFTDDKLESQVDFSKGPLRLRVRDHMYARVQVNSKEANVVLQECWFSEFSSSLLTNDSSKLVLVKNGCPMRREVNFIDPKLNDKVSIQLWDGLEGKTLFLHCQLNTCRRNAKSHYFESMKECSEMRSNCVEKGSPFRRPSTYYSIETTGIVNVLHLETNTLQSSMLGPFAKTPPSTDKNHPKAAGPNSGPRPEYVGLSAIPVVIIATASFFIGAAFVSLLWFINTKTDPAKQYAKRHSQRTSCHSSSSSYHQESHLNQKTSQISYGFDLCNQSPDSSPGSHQRVPFNAVTANTVFH